MGSYTISVVEDNEATKEAHFEKDGNWIDLRYCQMLCLRP